jgi:hypothetical protein
MTFHLATLSVAQTILGTPRKVTSIGGVGCEEIRTTFYAENFSKLTDTSGTESE